MSHDHHSRDRRSLVVSIILNFLITATETIGGLLSGSLSLLSDALHNFSDAIALIISLIALRLGERENSESKTFGYKRAEILAAFVNALALVLISIFLFKEALERFRNPVAIKTGVMLVVALVGLAANAASVILLKGGAKDNMNMRTVYLHLFSDALSSVGVILGALSIKFFGLVWVDPLLTIIIGSYVLFEGYKIVAETLKVLMQYTPEGMDVRLIAKAVEGIDGVKDIHHVHLWRLTDHDVHCEAHIDLATDMSVSRATEVRRRVENLMQEKFNINHATIQLEYQCCEGVPLVKP